MTGILGIGTMGASIACAITLAGMPVRIWNRRTPERVIEHIGMLLDKAIKKDEITETKKERALSLVEPTSQLSNMANSNIIIESVVEDAQIKKELLFSVSQICSDDAILATNTSSLSVTEIALATKCPERVIGMHFFNPAHKMELVEIFLTAFTAEHIYEQAKIFIQGLAKTPVVIEDSIGSIVNRILLLEINEAISILSNFHDRAEDIDNAICLGANHHMGPLRLADLIGLDVCLAILNNFHRRFGEEKFRPHPLLIEKVREGSFGKKTGQGFFCYGR